MSKFTRRVVVKISSVWVMCRAITFSLVIQLVLFCFRGVVKCETPLMLETICLLDISDFPFDQQECKIKVGSWSQPSHKIHMSFLLVSHLYYAMEKFSYSNCATVTQRCRKFWMNPEPQALGLKMKFRDSFLVGSTDKALIYAWILPEIFKSAIYEC